MSNSNYNSNINTNRINGQILKTPRTAPKTGVIPASERVGLDIIQNFKKESVKRYFSEMLSVMKTQYPTSSHIGKFIVGLSCEYLFCTALKNQNPPYPIFLCADDEVRNDVFFSGPLSGPNVNVQAGTHRFDYSLKYKKPNPSAGLNKLTVPNVRLVNTQGRINMDNIREDVFLIIPNPERPPPKKGATAPRRTFNPNPVKGRLVFIPHRLLTKDALAVKSDGVDLTSKFINNFIQSYPDYSTEIDVSSLTDLPSLDPIRILTDAALKSKNMRPLPEEIFSCRKS
jgi:hypothetical protein